MKTELQVRIPVIWLCIMLLPALGFSQLSRVDSLEAIAHDSRSPKIKRVDAILRWIDMSADTSLQAEILLTRAEYFSWSLHNDSLLSLVYQKRFHWYMNKNELTKAFRQNLKYINLAIRKKDTLMLGFAYWLRGTIYREIDLLEMSIEAEKHALHYFRKSGDEGHIAFHCYLMGWYLFNESRYTEALDYFKEAYQLHLKRNETDGMLSEDAGWISNSYSALENFEQAHHYRNISLAYAQKTKDHYVIGEAYRYLGSLYRSQRQPDSALFYHRKALNEYMQVDFLPSRRGLMKYEIAHTLFMTGKLKEAAAAIEDLLAHVKEYDFMVMQLADELGGEIFTRIGKPERAVVCYQRYINKKDSMDLLLKKENILANNLRVQFDQEQKDLMREQQVKEKQHKKEREFKNTELNLTLAASGLLIILVLFAIRSNRLRRKSNKILQLQKRVIEERNKEIMDSINYASRIQRSLQAKEENIKAVFPEYFIFNKPKGVVSGDFFWIEKVNNYILVAVADCTGHGVPGALVSVVCSNALTQAVREFGMLKPGPILDKTSELVSRAFKRGEEKIRDGMDISLCVIDRGNRKLYWAGANNPLWILRDNEMSVLKGNHQPIGVYEFTRPFITHEYEINRGDMIYLFSDGYADQFGGSDGKKFKYSNLKSLLAEIAAEPVHEQGEILKTTFNEWKGNYEQIDDVCILGIRLN